METGPLVAIGLDAFEVELVDRWSAAGELPNLAALRRQGRWWRLASEWPGIVFPPWHSFVAHRGVGEHGVLYLKSWFPEEGRIGFNPRWRASESCFWQAFVESGLAVATIDVPFAPPLERNPAQLVISGWQTHDEVVAGFRPAHLEQGLRQQLGEPVLGQEDYGHVSRVALLALRDRCLAAARQFRGLVLRALAEREWDLVLAVVGAAHRAGHYLWDPGLLARSGRIDQLAADALASGLRLVYRAVDEALGAIRAALPPRATLALFALHGMGAETPWTERLPLLLDFLSRGEGAGQVAAARGWLARARRSRLALAAARKLPQRLQEAMAGFTSRRLYDWSRTRAFAMPSEGTGCIRVNLRGRDRFGIVAPGAEYRDVLEQLAEGLSGLRELASGEPLVARIGFVDELVGESAPARPLLPDLAVQWRELPSGCARGIRTADGRVLDFGGPLYALSGRTGAHRPDGFLLVSGPAASAVPDGDYSTRDLPTLLRRLLGCRPARPVSGTS
ncbi:hypothetical protein HRbin40_01498 [bacterium HR40]|nr:hypothetical protein HRbin40_01498 [bacterium HR40]